MITVRRSRHHFVGLSFCDFFSGAIGTAKFTGARLLDVLQLAGLDTSKQPNFAHIHFIGLDAKDGTHYEASIPANLALKEDSNVLLIYEMNNRYNELL